MRVHATDLYLDTEDWAESANASMLVDPGRHWPGEWHPQRLIVQHMDARELRYEDESFDAVFSSSSLEHFGSDAEIARSLDEMFRVLKPGESARSPPSTGSPAPRAVCRASGCWMARNSDG